MDLLDPEFWKLPASLIDYWREIAGGVVVIGGAIGSILRWGLKPVRWAWSKLSQRSPTPDIRRPLRFVQDEQQSFWGPAKNGEEHGTQIAGQWHVTNISDRDVVLLRARLDGHHTLFGHVATEGLNDRLYSRTFPIHAHRMAESHGQLDVFSGNPERASGARCRRDLHRQFRERAPGALKFRSIRA